MSDDTLMEPAGPTEVAAVPTDWPTKKPHISFSELSNWMECAYRHKLLYIDNLGTDSGVTPHIGFGQAVHDANEGYLKTRTMDKAIAVNIMTTSWKEHERAFLEGPFPDWSPSGFGQLEDWLRMIDVVLEDVPTFLDDTFPGWTCRGAEEYLYEPIDGHPIRFKGFIDGILEVPDKRGRPKYWVIDWKTCGWGWRTEKKQDFRVQLQLVLYKHYWCVKNGIDPADVRCAFVLLKREGKKGRSIDLVPVSVGPVTSAKGLRVIDNHARAVSKGFFLKNRNSCRFCEFDDTENCRPDF